ncbi:MAG: hypothetical protein JSU74_07010, partial [Candidatus Zixiibacteriota bacterium]
MDTLTIVLIVLVVLNLVLTALMLSQWRRQRPAEAQTALQAAMESLKADLLSKQMEGLVSLRQSLDSANRLLNERLAEGTQTLDRRMAVVSEIENKLGQLSTQAKNIEAIGQNIQSLSDLLKP